MTFFYQVNHKCPFKSVDSLISEGVDAATFLAATRESLALLDKLGFAFRLVKTDILVNVSKLQATLDSDPVKLSTFRAMLESDVENNKSHDDYSATVALLWLKRSLEFFCSFATLLVSESRSGSPSDSLTHVVSAAYEQSLRRHHNWLMRGTFFFVARSMPSRRSFLKALANGQDGMDQEVIDDMDEFLKLLAPNLVVINQIFKDVGRPD